MSASLTARCHAAIQRRWQEGPGLLWLLWPLELLFRAVVAWRRTAFRRGWRPAQRAPIPVVVVGNITVGGTGKTPVALALCRALQAAGFRPGIASRGYGSEATQFPLQVTATTPAHLAGDEPLLLARRSGVPVVIAPQRIAAVRQLAELGCDVALCDDGLQHYALARDAEWVVIDGERRFGNGHCLPLGPLREPRSRLTSVDAVLRNGGPVTGDGTRFTLSPTGLQSLAGGEPQSLAAFRAAHPRVHAVAGIGHPQRFFITLRDAGIDVIEHPFPDHHRFSAADLAFGDALPVVMTEKDAVKCADFAAPAVAAAGGLWYLAVDAELPPAPVAALIERLRSLASRP